MEGQSGLSELSVISWVSAFEGCPLGGVPLYYVMLQAISNFLCEVPQSKRRQSNDGK